MPNVAVWTLVLVVVSLILPLNLVRAADQAAPLPVQVCATDPHLRYMGRWDTRDSAGPRAAWSASTLAFRFRGTAANLQLNGTTRDFLQVVIDGQPAAVLKIDRADGLYPLASGLTDSEHAIQIVKRTEAFCGVIQVTGLQLSEGAQLLDLPAPPRHIEVIGDSISCGYGNESKDQNEHFAPETQNAWQTYGFIAARAFGADYTCVAWSGRKMWPDNTMPEVYDLALPQDPASQWDASRSVPDVVLINLGTNDFGQNNPDEQKWTQAYLAFIDRLRSAYPDAVIYCVSGSMLTDAWPPDHQALSTVKRYLEAIVAARQAAGDRKVHTLHFDPQDEKDGLGGDWHPSVKTHHIMAEKLAQTLERDLAWKRLEGGGQTPTAAGRP